MVHGIAASTAAMRGGGASVIVIYRAPGNGPVISVDAATVTRVTLTRGAAVGHFAVRQSLVIPPEFIEADEFVGWPKIQKKIETARKGAEAKAVARLIALRDDLLASLRNVEIDLAAQGFLGAQGFSIAGVASAHLEINPLNMAGEAAADAVVFSAVVSAVAAAGAGTQGRVASARLEVTLTRAGLLEALPSFSAEAAPNVPALDLRWPRLAWPSLDWANLKVGGLNRLLRLDLPVGGVASPIEVKIPGLVAEFALSPQNVLTFSTGQARDGEILVSGTGGAQRLATITGFALSVDSQGALNVAGRISAANKQRFSLERRVLDQPRALPFRIEVAPYSLEIELDGEIVLPTMATAATIEATLTLPKVVVRSKRDPDLLLALAATYVIKADLAGGATSGQLTELNVVDPYPLKLVGLAPRAAVDAAQAAADAAAGILRLIGGIELPKVPSANLQGVLDRLLALLKDAVVWLTDLGADLFGALLGLAESLVDLLVSIVEKLRKLWPDNATAPHLSIEVQLDTRTYRPLRIILAPARPQSDAPSEMTLSGLGLEVRLPADCALAVVIDLGDAPGLALLATPPAGSAVSLSTDLWLASPTGVEGVRDTRDGKRPPNRLITITATPNAQAVAVARWSGGKVCFFEGVEGPGKALGMAWTPPGVDPDRLRLVQIDSAPRYVPLTANFDVQTDLDKARRLPFLKSGPESGSGMFDDIAQYIEIARNGQPTVVSGHAEIPLLATLKMGDTQLPMPLVVELDVRSLSATFKGGTSIPIQGDAKTREIKLFGLTGVLTGAPGADSKYKYFDIDIAGSPGIALADKAKLALTYGKIAAGGDGLVFNVSSFRVSSGGLDLEAEVDPSRPVTLAGVGMPFRFKHGALSVKRSQIQGFSIAGAGQLPPELVGEANASIAIAFGRDKSSGDLVVKSAEAKLDKSADPLVCHGTWFDFTLSAIGLEYHDFSNENGGYHFYFTLTGSAEFRPRSADAVQGLLKNLAGTKIILDKVPLARDPSMLAQAIRFQIPVNPPKRFNVFNLFTFELRGIGLHPASKAFGGKPAICITGQVNFVEAGDAISPRFDFHELWIAPPKSGDWVPQVRFDGLTVGLRLGGQGSVEGTAMAVDDQMPSLFRAGVLPGGYTARGFLASGKLSIQGWASMAAAMGFLELSDGKGGAPRHAFFIAANMRELSYTIPTPVGNLYLRQVGFGLGFRYTLAAFNAADQVSNVGDLIKALDEISRYQGDLASIRSWEPEAEGDRVTLALSGVISLATASTESTYNRSKEKELSNPVLFDVVVALRSDLTFFLAARVWVCFNYEDYNSASPSADWLTKPTLRGYTYLSVPRQEFLARLIADGKGEIGPHPQLPSALIDAMKGADIRWSATTYIRPGLFHQEFGWPYELGFSLKNGDRFRIDCSGGLIHRIEDGAMLFGIAFKASGWAQIGGSVGGRSFGASVRARADFTLDTKLIAYISIAKRDDTLFYGSLAFETRIELEVRVWLEFSVPFRTIRLEVGFSQTLTVSLALEVAATPSSIGGRGSAAVGVSGFGRSLRLGIGVSFNTEELDKARARVERFLQLGLTVSTPDPAKALEPPAPSPPREKASAQADRKLETQIAKQDAVKAPTAAGGATEPPAAGRDIGPAAWWAMLFRTTPKGEAPQYILTFIPRDATETGLDEQDLPRHHPDGPFAEFYPPPKADATQPAVEFRPRTTHEALQVTLSRLKADGTAEPFEVKQGSAVGYENAFAVAKEGADVLTLGDFLANCYVLRNGSPGAYAEPLTFGTQAKRTRLPQDRQAAADALMEAGRDLLDLGAERRKSAELDERRSAAIASLADSAQRLAAGGEVARKAKAEGRLDVRAMGLAFLVGDEELEALFEPTSNDSPRAARFHLWPAGVAAPTAAMPANVHLFNPPKTMFDANPPTFVDARARITPTGVRLSWDLEPMFGASDGVWRDPEFRVLHYRIERKITGINDDAALWRPHMVTSKPAAPAALVRDPRTGEFVWRLIHPDAQYLDDLADLPEAVRTALLRPDKAPPKPKPGQPPESALMTRVRNNDIQIRYRVTPVDVAGAEGYYAEISFDPPPLPGPAREPLRQATLEMEYPSTGVLPRPHETPPEPSVTLTIDDPELRAAIAAGKRELRYEVKVRAEGTSPTGLFGADALTDAKARPGPSDFAELRVDDKAFIVAATLPLRFDADAPLLPVQLRTGLVGAGAWSQFLREIGVTTPEKDRILKGPRAVRFAVRPVTDDGVMRWTPADAAIGFPTPVDSPREPVLFPAEVFEHPLAIEPAPLLRQDMRAKTGRLRLLYPPAQGGLSNFLEPDDKVGPAFARLRDPARRVGTQIRWRPRPIAKDPVAGKRAARDLWRYFGGFNLYQLDVGSEAEGASASPGVAALDFRFDIANGATPDAGEVTLAGAKQNEATELRISFKDDAKLDRRELLATFGEIRTPPSKVTLAGSAGRFLEFEILGWRSAAAHRTLIISPLRASAPNPFKAGDKVRLVYQGATDIRPVARVMALPKSLERLDPAEIADFGKVEARYPSDTARVRPKLAGKKRTPSTRLAAWYSPSESYVAWPKRLHRRSIAVNIDEHALTALLMAGRPTRLVVEVRVSRPDSTTVKAKPDLHASTFAYGYKQDLADKEGSSCRAGETWSVAETRNLLQSLVVRSDDLQRLIEAGDAELHAAEVVVTAQGPRPNQETWDGPELGQTSWSIDLDPPLHPVLADIIDWARYHEAPDDDLMRLQPAGKIPTLEDPSDIEAVEFELTGWPEALPTKLVFEQDGRLETALLWPVGDRRASPIAALLEQARSTACVDLGATARRRAREAASKTPELFAAARVQVYVHHRTQAGLVRRPLVELEVPVEALLRPGQVTRYRRYEPVLEPPPRSDARDVAAWMDETPTPRDPYGWSILRRMGLATGLRLFDTERDEYAPPEDTLKHLQAAFDAVLPRYRDDKTWLGTPFVDLITRPGGATHLVDFDGGVSEANAEDRRRLLDDEALALTQISLRPASQLVAQGDGGPIGYFRVEVGPEAGVITFNLKDAPAGTVIELQDLSKDLAGPPVVAIATPAPKWENRKTPEPMLVRLRRELLGGDGPGYQHSLVVPAATDPAKLETGKRTVALMRVTVMSGAPAAVQAFVTGGALTAVKAPLSGDDGEADPFGRFPEITPERFSALVAQAEAATQTSGGRVKGHEQALAAASTFRAYAGRIFKSGWPKADAPLLERLPEWTRRFLDHGAVGGPSDTQLGIAEVVRPEPWRVGGADEEGFIGVLLTHDDLRRRARRYMVEPFGRYESLADAVRGTALTEVAGQRPRDYVEDVRADELARDWNRRLIDATTPRTEPLAPPALILARKIEAPLETGVARTLEFLYARHPEEILSESNLTAEGALSFEGVSVGLFREFSYRSWSQGLPGAPDPLAQIGSWATPEPAVLVRSPDGFGGLARGRSADGAVAPGRYEAGWGGVTAIRAGALPWFFRTHAVAYATAGVVVSDPVIGTIPEGHHDLALPWKTPLKPGESHVTDPPTWSVERGAQGVEIIFEVPLVRFGDSMTDPQRKAWLLPNATPQVFTLPNPDVRWDIRLEASDPSGATITTSELDIAAEVIVATGGDPMAVYRVTAVGSRFEATEPLSTPSERDGVWRGAWRVRTPDAPLGSAPVLRPQLEDENPGLWAYELDDAFGSADGAWARLAPFTTVELRIDPPVGGDWAARQQDARAWRDALTPCVAGSSAAAALRSVLADFFDAADPAGWWAARGWGSGADLEAGKVRQEGFAAGLPHLAANRPASVRISRTSGFDWPSPTDLTLEALRAVRRLEPTRTAPDAPDHPTWLEIRAALASEVRRLVLVRKARADAIAAKLAWSQETRTAPSFLAALPDAVAGDAETLARAKGGDGKRLLPACLDVLVQRTVTLQPGHADDLWPLAHVLEDTPFCAAAVGDVLDLIDAAQGATQPVSGEVRLPASALSIPAVLALLPDPPGVRVVLRLLLRAPPNNAERERIRLALETVVAARRARLATVLDDAMADQLFGRAQRPQIRATHGPSGPLPDAVGPKAKITAEASDG